MAMEQPVVSVIIPVFNAEGFIADAIESALQQDYPHTEIVVVDDGSTDGSERIVRQFPAVRYIYQDNQGPSIARNRAVKEAKGELLAFLDADDIWKPKKLSQQVAAWREARSPSVVLCQGRYLVQNKSMPVPSGYTKQMIDAVFPAQIPSGLLVSREAFERVGGFDPMLRNGEDTDWFLRAHENQISVIVVPELLLEKRIHGSNLTSNAEHVRKQMMVVLHASILRRRIGGKIPEKD